MSERSKYGAIFILSTKKGFNLKLKLIIGVYMNEVLNTPSLQLYLQIYIYKGSISFTYVRQNDKIGHSSRFS